MTNHPKFTESHDSAARGKGESMAKESRLLTAIERLGKLLREPHHGLAPWTEAVMKCARTITDYLGIYPDDREWHRFMNQVRNEGHRFPCGR